MLNTISGRCAGISCQRRHFVDAMRDQCSMGSTEGRSQPISRATSPFGGLSIPTSRRRSTVLSEENALDPDESSPSRPAEHRGPGPGSRYRYAPDLAARDDGDWQVGGDRAHVTRAQPHAVAHRNLSEQTTPLRTIRRSGNTYSLVGRGLNERGPSCGPASSHQISDTLESDWPRPNWQQDGSADRFAGC